MAMSTAMLGMPALAPARRSVASAKSSAAFGGRAALRAHTRSVAPARSAVQVRAANINTEELLIKAQRTWDTVENKPVVVGYSVGLLVGLYFVESLIHLPVLNLVIGFPLELLGVMSAGALALRYTVEGVDPTTDLAKVQATLQDTLPGLK
jgi:hypothetical protein